MSIPKQALPPSGKPLSTTSARDKADRLGIGIVIALYVGGLVAFLFYLI